MKKPMLIAIISILLVACAGNGMSSKQDVEVNPYVTPTVTVEKAKDITTETSVVTKTETTSDQAQVKGKEVTVGEVITNNGFSVEHLLVMLLAVIGGLLLFGFFFGMIIPQPRFIRWFF